MRHHGQKEYRISLPGFDFEEEYLIPLGDGDGDGDDGLVVCTNK